MNLQMQKRTGASIQASYKSNKIKPGEFYNIGNKFISITWSNAKREDEYKIINNESENQNNEYKFDSNTFYGKMELECSTIKYSLNTKDTSEDSKLVKELLELEEKVKELFVEDKYELVEWSTKSLTGN